MSLAVCEEIENFALSSRNEMYIRVPNRDVTLSYPSNRYNIDFNVTYEG